MVHTDVRFGKLSGDAIMSTESGNDSQYAMYCSSTVQPLRCRAAVPTASLVPWATSEQERDLTNRGDNRTIMKRAERRALSTGPAPVEAYGVITGRGASLSHDPALAPHRGRAAGLCRPEAEYGSDAPFARGSTFGSSLHKDVVKKGKGQSTVAGKIGSVPFNGMVYQENYDSSARSRRTRSDLHRDGQMEDDKLRKVNQGI
eukprot:CAMPEP_0198210306 /NCGR_PEP_ID=MMETSP1445-20131203/20023_1 /TAXON_ID=36898 /ORGANISM="Pyramimonas sp., Strain CCMP2087" /LENGTH=201 /DNA_ID=CAMNT_0043884335 /DNA_START=49 /DNA_END=654 /DNA_ORIENTATION=+